MNINELISENMELIVNEVFKDDVKIFGEIEVKYSSSHDTFYFKIDNRYCADIYENHIAFCIFNEEYGYHEISSITLDDAVKFIEGVHN